MTGRPVPMHPPCVCGHLDVLHNLSSTGRRTGCSVSDGPRAIPCGCTAFTPPDDGALFDLPQPQARGGGVHL